jgi:hypothetical protein
MTQYLLSVHHREGDPMPPEEEEMTRRSTGQSGAPPPAPGRSRCGPSKKSRPDRPARVVDGGLVTLPSRLTSRPARPPTETDNDD